MLTQQQRHGTKYGHEQKNSHIHAHQRVSGWIGQQRGRSFLESLPGRHCQCEGSGHFRLHGVRVSARFILSQAHTITLRCIRLVLRGEAGARRTCCLSLRGETFA